MIVNTARFIISNTKAADCPKEQRHEYAFIGRSNVGKSSLINMLTGKKGLAMTSSTPGKTMLINHFLVNDEWMIVDLPGYGYAKRSKADRIRLEGIISDYILNRQQMTNLFVLIDSRHKPQKSTLNSWNGLAKTESHSALFSQNLTNSAHRPEKNRSPPIWNSYWNNGKNSLLYSGHPARTSVGNQNFWTT